MDKEVFYEQRNFDEYNMNREPWSENSPARSLRRDDRNISNRYDNDIDGEPLDTASTFDDPRGASVFDYDHVVGSSAERRGARWRDPSGHVQADDLAGSRDRQSTKAPRQDDKHSSKYRDHGDDAERKSRSRGYGYGTEDSSGRGRQRSKSRERDRVRDSRDRERSKDRDRRSRRDGGESGYGNERDDSEYRSRRRSRSRDRDRDRRYRDSDRDRRRRDSDRERHRRDRDRDRESSPKDVPWVPPPLPEHLRHLQVQWTLNPGAGNQQPSSSSAGILGAPPPLRPTVQNQFQNDGSFMEMFRQKMQEQQQAATVSDDSNTCEGPALPNTGAVVEAVSTATVPPPTLPTNSSGVPVIAKRRISKILKTGIVQKKKKEEEEEPDKDADGWSSYMKEVQRYRANKCIENEASRPPLVK